MRIVFASILLICTIAVYGTQPSGEKLPVKDVVIKVDTLQFRYSKDVIVNKGDKQLYFFYNTPDEICELNIYPQYEGKIQTLELLKSLDFVQIDSMVFVNHEYFRTRVKFVNLNKAQFLSFIFNIQTDNQTDKSTYEVKLFPYTKTNANFYPSSEELYIGEEKIFELVTNNQSNIRTTNEWTTGQSINYLVSEHNGQLRLHLLPAVLGNQQVTIRLQTNRPSLNEKKEIIYDLPEINRTFKIKTSRLAFLNIDRKEITYDDAARRDGIELQIESNRQLLVNKTYRIENQEQPGGALIAELFVKRVLANDRSWCILRPYNLHRQTEGYLYIKDGDDPKFITNLSITPRTSINSIQVMHEGQEWSGNLNVFPDETVEVKIEGEGLHKAKFHWEDVVDITSDTLTRSENVCYFKLRIPMNINKKRIALYNQMANTGYALAVREYQTPHNLDFITLNFGKGTKAFSTLSPTIIQRNTINDVTIGFDNSKIDSDKKLYGKQYLDIDVRIIGKSGELIEMKQIKNLVICPDDKSPRSAYYKDRACTNSDISLNTQMSNKTYNLTDFSKVQLEIHQQSDKYGDQIFSKQIELVLQRRAIFDIDVSFPAGLLIQNLGQTQSEKESFAKYDKELASYQVEYNAYMKELELWTANPSGSRPSFSSTEPTKPEKAAFTDNLGGISMAIIMQFSFPDPEKVGRTKPYRLGAGFLAINAFNFSESAKRDLAAVALASLYPIKPGKLFSLPIHIGFGYKFQDKIPFVMLSPGIGIKF